MPKISIIVPVYNVEKYLRKCVDSILNQTFKDFELILVDDGSIDTSGKICDEYNLKDNRIKVIHKENGGLSSARNAGLDIAQGEYIGFVDSDDWIELDMYEELYKICKENDTDVGIVGINYGGASEKKKSKKIEIYSNKLILDDLVYNKGKEITWPAWNKLWLKKVIGESRFKEGRIYEDGLFLYSLSSKIKKVAKIDYEAYNYRMDNESITRSKISKKQVDFLYNTLDIYKFLPSPYKEEMFIRDLIRYTEYILLEMIKQKNINKDIIKEIKKFYNDNFKMVKKENKLSGFLKWKLFVLSKYPKIYILLKKLTKRY
ncbi:MAG: glycosyltransferase [Candidatus Fusobacterium pullicola]|uniref:Glycosyltransferase n=1 Tax=Candidatus Fusobacterium pullicola TaxID=2838601 RepID=A0A9E2NWP6_9FUSO|nr:glycosyltransferase [Candidatus Fusobacterium pullicola]